MSETVDLFTPEEYVNQIQSFFDGLGIKRIAIDDITVSDCDEKLIKAGIGYTYIGTIPPSEKIIIG